MHKDITIEGKQVSVIGAGKSGVAAARLLQSKGAVVFVSEEAEKAARQEEAAILKALNISAEFGGHSRDALNADWMMISPGVPIDHDLVLEAKKRKLPVVGELEVASWFCRATMIGVTGSNGKSTTTSLIGEIFRADGRQAVVAGNIGRSFASVVEETEETGVAVLEVSSFQLETIDRFHPHIAVFLNLTPDHLDRHGSMEQYGKMKARIFENQTGDDYTVYDIRDEWLKRLVRKTRGKRAVFGLKADEPCAYIEKETIYVRISDQSVPIIRTGEMNIKGAHNHSNAMAAALTGKLMGATTEGIYAALARFTSLAHRMEFVEEIRQVTWINDSKGTNTDATWFALGSFKQPVILIAGGKDKDSDFTRLNDRIKEHAKLVILIGQAADKMENAFRAIVELRRAASLADAVRIADQSAQPGDVVLLSPACASFDMFKNFQDRGNQFKSLVRELV